MSSAKTPANTFSTTQFLGDRTPTVGASVVSAAFSGAQPNTFDTVTITFSENIQADIVGPGDVVLTGPDGLEIPVTLTFTASDTPQLVATFVQQSAVGGYTISVGPNVLDVLGNPMDQNGNGLGGKQGEAPIGDKFSRTANLGTKTILAVGGADGAVQIVDANTGAVLIDAFRPFDTATSMYTGIISVALGTSTVTAPPTCGSRRFRPRVRTASISTPTPVAFRTPRRRSWCSTKPLAQGKLPTEADLLATFIPFAKTDSAELDSSVTGVTNDWAYTNGVNIAVGDVNGDGTPDLVAGTRGGSAGFGLSERGRLVVVSGADPETFIGTTNTFPFSDQYQKGVVVATVDLDGPAVPGVQIAVTAAARSPRRTRTRTTA